MSGKKNEISAEKIEVLDAKLVMFAELVVESKSIRERVNLYASMRETLDEIEAELTGEKSA